MWPNPYLKLHSLFLLWKQELMLILILIALFGQCSINTKKIFSKKESIPRSTPSTIRCSSGLNNENSTNDYRLNTSFKCCDDPPWNLSPLIDFEGFLTRRYRRIPGEWEIEANIAGRHGSRGHNFLLLDRKPVTIRQVPGDGNCLFHSLSACLSLVESGRHVPMRRRLVLAGRDEKNINSHLLSSRISIEVDNSTQVNDKTQVENQKNSYMHLYESSRILREKAVDMLSSNPRRLLFLQGSEYLRCGDLVDTAAAQYGLSGKEYCNLMKKDAYWGGGPEIVALVNFLKRPIHVYELCTLTLNYNRKYNFQNKMKNDNHSDSRKVGYGKRQNNSCCKERGQKKKSEIDLNTGHDFGLRRMACFGSPKFDGKEPLHILSADSRFPDIVPGKQLSSGNHFLSIFPCNDIDKNSLVVSTLQL